MQEAIKVGQLSKSYGNLPAVDHIDLSVKQGTVYGLLGANGAGKSTTIECILGTRQTDSGTVSVLGRDPRKESRKLFQSVGVQFQESDYQPEIKVSELCEETAYLYQSPADWKKLCAQFGIGDKTKAVFYGTIEQAKEQSGCTNFEDAYLYFSGEEVGAE